MEDLVADPPLAHCDFWRRQRHKVLGPFAYETAGFILSKTPVRMGRPSPRPGEHDERVFKRLLGLADDDDARLLADGAIA